MGDLREESLPAGTVTFLLTDIEGSTALWQRDAEKAARAVGRHDALIAEHVAAYGAERPRDQGEGDSALLVFSRARDALACAIALQRAFCDEPWPAGAAVRVRMALHTGEAETIAGNYKGTAVHRCAHLRALAHGGQVLLSDTTTQVVRDRLPETVELLDLGRHSLRGLDEDEHVFQMLHPSLPSEFGPLVTGPESMAGALDEPVPLPALLAVRPDGDALDVFVGREADVGQLTERLDKITEGPAQFVMISGEAGIGKTRLCTELARIAHASGTKVLYGRCDQEFGLPYQPWIEALTHLVLSAPGLVHAREGAELARLVPAVRDAVQGLPATPPGRDQETERYLLFGAVAALLAAASRDTPVLIVLDDLHWSDKPTLSLLRHLVTSPIALRVLVVCAYRDSDIRRGDPLHESLALLWHEPGAARMALEGLDNVGVLALLEAAAGHSMADDVTVLVHALHRETDGNPFFTREILRHLAETRAIVQDEQGRWRADFELSDVQLPASVREVVAQRVAHLGDGAHRILSTAAVIGRDFDLDLLARVAECREDDLLDVLDEAVAATVVQEVPGRAERFTFAHALIQRTLYEELSRARRGRLHRRVAEILEELGSDAGDRVGELAHHWAAASGPIQTTKAIDYAKLAGEGALAALAPDEAIRWFEQALQFLAADPGKALTRCDLLIALGTAQFQAGDVAYRQTLLDAGALAQDAGDVGRLVAAALANSRGQESLPGAVDHERVAMLEAALEMLGPVETTERARLLATLALELMYARDPELLRALADDALALARRLGDAATLVQVLNAHHYALRLPETLAARQAGTREAVELAEALRDEWACFHALRNRVQVAIESGDGAERDRAVDRAAEIAARVAHPLLQWLILTDQASRRLVSGDPEAAEATAEQALALGTESGQPEAFIVYGTQLIDIRIHQGRGGELVDLMAEAVAENPGLPAFRCGLARAFRDAGRDDDARALLRVAGSNGFEDVQHDELRFVSLTTWAQIAAALREVAPAELLYEILRPWAGRFPTATVAVSESVDHCLGELAASLDRDEEAADHFHAADALARSLGAPFYIARAQLELARLDLRSGRDAEAARARIEEARTLAVEHGYAGVERDAAAMSTYD